MEGKSHMHSAYFHVQMHLLDVSLTCLLSGAIFSSRMIYGQGALPVSICKQPSPGWERVCMVSLGWWGLPPCPAGAGGLEEVGTAPHPQPHVGKSV